METSGDNFRGEYDAIVVGSGAAGGWAAKELAEKGLEVLVLESGRAIQPDTDYPNLARWQPPQAIWPRLLAAAKGQHIQARCRSWTHQTKHFFVSDRENPYSVAKGSHFLWFRGQQEGGRLHVWARISPRMSDLDFAAASLDGYGRDWPLTYRDLAPYYDRVEGFLGLYGSAHGLSHFPDGKYAEPWPPTAQETTLREVVEGRWPGRRVVSAPIMRQASRVPPTLVAARNTGRCDIRCHSMATRIELDSRLNQARGVSFLDRTSRKSHTVQARVVVLCASTIESIRLLFNSGCSRHPNGLGNSSGLLGHGFMDNTFVSFFGKTDDFERPPRASDLYDPSRGVGFIVPQFRNVTSRDMDFRRSYTICGAVGRGGPFWWMSCFGSMLPYPENCITIHPSRKDAWGISVPHVRLAYRDNEWKMLADQKQSLQEMMAAAGLKQAEWGSTRRQRLVLRHLSRAISYDDAVLLPGSAIHECGGAPMGSDPKNSVLNDFNRCWDIPNVFVTDASSFVTCPAVNLTNTIMALTARACDHIVRLWKSGDL
jgi:choline dehydrogenase-like flavoprotein